MKYGRYQLPYTTPTTANMATIHAPRPLRPGQYAARVVDASLASFAWRSSPRNPNGVTVKVVVETVDDDGIPATVIDTLDVTHTRRLEAVFLACGLPLDPSQDVAECAESLIGCDATILVRNITPQQGPNQGNTRAVVSDWVAVRV